MFSVPQDVCVCVYARAFFVYYLQFDTLTSRAGTGPNAEEVERHYTTTPTSVSLSVSVYLPFVCCLHQHPHLCLLQLYESLSSVSQVCVTSCAEEVMDEVNIISLLYCSSQELAFRGNCKDPLQMVQ